MKLIIISEILWGKRETMKISRRLIVDNLVDLVGMSILFDNLDF